MDTEQPNLETSNNVQSKSLELREAERKREQEKRKRDAVSLLTFKPLPYYQFNESFSSFFRRLVSTQGSLQMMQSCWINLKIMFYNNSQDNDFIILLLYCMLFVAGILMKGAHPSMVMTD